MKIERQFYQAREKEAKMCSREHANMTYFICTSFIEDGSEVGLQIQMSSVMDELPEAYRLEAEKAIVAAGGTA